MEHSSHFVDFCGDGLVGFVRQVAEVQGPEQQVLRLGQGCLGNVEEAGIVGVGLAWFSPIVGTWEVNNNIFDQCTGAQPTESTGTLAPRTTMCWTRPRIFRTSLWPMLASGGCDRYWGPVRELRLRAPCDGATLTW